MSQVSNKGELKIDRLESPIKSLLVYWESEPADACTLKECEGGFVTNSAYVIWSYSFQGQIYLRKDYKNLEISEVKMITPNHVAVSLIGQNYLEIFNVFTGELVHQMQLNNKIKLMVVDESDIENRPIIRDKLGVEFLIIAFENGLISVFEVKAANANDKINVFKKTTDNNFELNIVYEVNLFYF